MRRFGNFAKEKVDRNHYIKRFKIVLYIKVKRICTNKDK